MLYQGETTQLRWLENGIAELLFHSPASVNTLDSKTLTSLSSILDILENLPTLKGLLICSNKNTFIVGADITEFLSLFSAPKKQLKTWLKQAQQTFNRLEDLPIPSVVILNGYTLGGGCECALSADFRLASPDVRIGLPETKLGIIPGFGGTVRLPRLIGADNAIELIASGKELTAEHALSLGIVDAIVPTEHLIEVALQMLTRAIQGELDWRHRRHKKQMPLCYSAIEAKMSFSVATAQVLQTAGAHYPAPLAAVKTIAAAATLKRDAALQQEIEHFLPLAYSTQAQALVKIFLNEQYVKGKAKQWAKQAVPAQYVAVLGAGIMGGGIAYQSALKGIPVLLKDIKTTALTTGMHEAITLLNQQVHRQKIDPLRAMSILSTIQPTLHNAGIEQADIVVEAVVEQLAIKQTVLQETETLLNDAAVLASNTSTLPITQLASGLQHPERFCGMHFFNPVHSMPLVEVVRGTQSTDKTIAQVVSYALKIGKIPIIVADCPGFFVNRVLFPYLHAFCQLVLDGIDFKRIDHVMETQFGWPMGPAYLLDLVGIDTAYHVQGIMAQGFPDRMGELVNSPLETLFNQQRYGQKNLHGFYRYQADKKGRLQKQPDSSISTLLDMPTQATNTLSDEAIIARLMIPMLNETVRCLDEAIIASPAEADIALVYGIGFPPFQGGAFCYLDTYGLQKYVKIADSYRHLGALYQVPDSLREKAKQRKNYHPLPQSFRSKTL